MANWQCHGSKISPAILVALAAPWHGNGSRPFACNGSMVNSKIPKRKKRSVNISDISMYGLLFISYFHLFLYIMVIDGYSKNMSIEVIYNIHDKENWMIHCDPWPCQFRLLKAKVVVPIQCLPVYPAMRKHLSRPNIRCYISGKSVEYVCIQI
jgi:hypothetical protein